MEVNDHTRALRAYSLLTLALPCILGMDFLMAFGVVVNFALSTWGFADELSSQYAFERESTRFLAASLAEETPAREMAAAEGAGETLPLPGERKPTDVVGVTSNPPKRGETRDPTAIVSSRGGLSELSGAEQQRFEIFGVGHYRRSRETGGHHSNGASYRCRGACAD